MKACRQQPDIEPAVATAGMTSVRLPSARSVSPIGKARDGGRDVQKRVGVGASHAVAFLERTNFRM